MPQFSCYARRCVPLLLVTSSFHPHCKHDISHQALKMPATHCQSTQSLPHRFEMHQSHRILLHSFIFRWLHGNGQSKRPLYLACHATEISRSHYTCIHIVYRRSFIWRRQFYGSPYFPVPECVHFLWACHVTHESAYMVPQCLFCVFVFSSFFLFFSSSSWVFLLLHKCNICSIYQSNFQ